MSSPARTLVCFAVKEEAKWFARQAGRDPDLRILLTGVGRRNAEKNVAAALAEEHPAQVITAGFAGGLIPELASGTVVYPAEQQSRLDAALHAAGARPVRFHCADRIVTTAEQKRALNDSTGAEAVEMESQHIHRLCRERGVPAVTIRVILDTASEDLALDFNQLMTGDERIDWRKLTLALLKSPSKVSALLRLQKQSDTAAQRLAEVLIRVLGNKGPAVATA